MQRFCNKRQEDSNNFFVLRLVQRLEEKLEWICERLQIGSMWPRFNFPPVFFYLWMLRRFFLFGLLTSYFCLFYQVLAGGEVWFYFLILSEEKCYLTFLYQKLYVHRDGHENSLTFDILFYLRKRVLCLFLRLVWLLWLFFFVSIIIMTFLLCNDRLPPICYSVINS